MSDTSKYSLDEKGKHKRGNNDMKQTKDGKRLRKIRQLLNDKLVKMWAKFFKTCLNSVFASFFSCFSGYSASIFRYLGELLGDFQEFLEGK